MIFVAALCISGLWLSDLFGGLSKADMVGAVTLGMLLGTGWLLLKGSTDDE